MTDDKANEIVDKIFEDLRNRKFLKWLFCNHPEDAGAILLDQNGVPLMPLDSSVQNEIRESWKFIIQDAE